jgi:hypothetical protein
MSPNGTYIGGYATRIQSSPTIEERMAVFWSGTTMTPLFSEPTLLLGRSGEVRAVNNAGEFVGSRILANGVGQLIPKAFRSEANGNGVGPSDFLIPPFQDGVVQANVPSVALSINPRVGQFSGVAVGWAGYNDSGVSYPQPSIWWSRTNGSAEPTNAYWLKLPSRSDSGHAQAITDAGTVYGWISNDGGTTRRAWKWPNGWDPGDGMDEKYAVYGFNSSWDFEEFVDGTDSGLVLGNGRKDGSKRAFLLVPQPTSN